MIFVSSFAPGYDVCEFAPKIACKREREGERGRNTRAVLSLTCAFLILLSFNAGKRFLSIFIFPLLVQRPTHVRRNETVFFPLPSEFFRTRTHQSFLDSRSEK